MLQQGPKTCLRDPDSHLNTCISYSPGDLYPNFPLTDGTTFKVKRRERQYVLLSEDRQPLWWYNGVAGLEYDKDAGKDHTYSTAQPFNTAVAQLHQNRLSQFI